jgi:DNA-binding beta-propeller fold protein YncE
MARVNNGRSGRLIPDGCAHPAGSEDGHRRRGNGPTMWRSGVIRALVGLTVALWISWGGLSAAWAQEELFVTNAVNNSVTVYSRTASGSPAPIRTLAGAATGLSNPVGLAVDTVNNELVVANNNDSVTVYSRTASGNTPPIRRLAGAGPPSGLT